MRAAIGVTGQFSAVDNLLTGEENLILMADLHHLGRAEGRRRAADLLERFGLVDAARRPAATYSGGMRRRLDLAMTLVGDPRIIFLDEPTTGLDPRSRHTMWEIIRGLVADGVTIFLTTQYLEEADRLADRIAVLDHGTADRRGHRGASSSGWSRARTSACSSATRTSWTRPPARCATPSAATRPWPSRCRATAAPRRCAPCSSASTPSPSPSPTSPSTPPTSTTSSSPSPGAEHAHDRLCHPGLRDDAAAQPPPHAALPVVGRRDRRHPDRLPAAVRVRLRRHARRRPGRRVGRARRVPRLRHAGHPRARGGRRGHRARRSRSPWT